MTDAAPDLPVVLTVPPDALWLRAKDAAAMIGYDVRVFSERIALSPGFPQPWRHEGKGYPRWNAGELHEWIVAEREKTGGRKRAA